ncbi:unnamed protein product [Phytophthora lilii]|uniref:Unnamed protein product n=1 Tax=Phytophthora lilii TaxID=2077276 RepID=A0A9W6TNV7_9STRA|nr:unnamed protein product [Phytophthora lilii]
MIVAAAAVAVSRPWSSYPINPSISQTSLTKSCLQLTPPKLLCFPYSGIRASRKDGHDWLECAILDQTSTFDVEIDDSAKVNQLKKAIKKEKKHDKV